MGGIFLTRSVGMERMIVRWIALVEIYSGACLYAMPVNFIRDIAWPVLCTEDTHLSGFFFKYSCFTFYLPPVHFCKAMSSSGGSKVSYIITLQHTSPCLKHEMMESVGVPVDEIVMTRDQALTYVYIHLLQKIREPELEAGIGRLVDSHGLRVSNIYG